LLKVLIILPKIILPSKIPGLRHRVARRAPGQALLFLKIYHGGRDMITKSLLRVVIYAFALVIHSWVAAQQGAVITGAVSDERGNPLPGARVFIELTNLGAAADVTGKYRFTVPAKVVRGQEVRLTARFIGYRLRTEKIVLQPGDLIRNFALSEDVLDLDAIITTGVLDETPKTKMAFSAAARSEKALNQAPAISPETALYGKVAGLKVVRGNGQPGESASLLLRGATSINASGRSQDPLYIVDGAIFDPSISGSPLTDIPADEIESMEVVKGAAGASTYGSRGANGVIRITTRRGKYLGLNQTRVVVRNEIGASSLAGKIKLNQHHGYKIAASAYIDANGVQVTPGDFIDRNGNWLDPRLFQRQLDTYRDPAQVPHTTGISFHDKPYKYVATGAKRDPITGRITLPTDANGNVIPPQLLSEPFDQIDRFFDPGLFLSNTISISRNMETTNFLVSFGNRTETGVVGGIDGLNRKNFRLNLDHQIRPSLSLGVSGLYSQTKRDLANPSAPFFALTFMAPDADITARDENGQLFIRPDPTALEDNPLYFVENNDRDDSRSRILGNLNLRWEPVTGFNLEGNLGFDRSDRETELFWPIGYESISLGREFAGRLIKSNISEKALNGSIAASFARRFGDLIFRAKGQGLFERDEFDSIQADGWDLSVRGARNLQHARTHVISSQFGEIRSRGYAFTMAFDFKDRYLGDLHFRRDKSSLFGADEKWQTYYRTSAVYRLAQEPWWFIPGFEEFKLRAAFGAAGSRPNYFAGQDGNEKLKPELAKELELGVDLVFLKRFALELAYARLQVEDQILLVPVAGPFGFTNEWRNVGTLEPNTIEATLNASILSTRDFRWTAGIVFDRIRQRITKLDAPPYFQAPFYIKEDEELGAIYGDKWIENSNDLPAGIPQEQFNVNDDGYVVWVGDGNTFRDGLAKDLWGASTTMKDQYGVNHTYRWGIPIKFQEARFKNDGSFDRYNQFVKLGSTVPDFNLGLHSDFRWKGVTIYAVLEAQIGGQIYNNTNQWGLRELRLGEADQFGKPDELKKPGLYYQTLYNVNAVNSHFVEDATYLKLRELAVTYTFDRSALSGLFGGFLEKLTVGVAGRNLLTFTGYKGYDPEVGTVGFDMGSAALARFDGFSYSNFRTISGVIEFEF
jgi:TonB-dependent SusC/RagA subfamily outer membrane receptor